ncbi:MAG: putative lipid II flippase FtsW [Candidatus Acetothermia bacterium]|nr:putative lipid II flippase FtsW [Candidatus Acetothermia bacterium]MDH7504898.1 putative lipid II flippase FtsW [Candidatus Acetothermia bacterium]
MTISGRNPLDSGLVLVTIALLLLGLVFVYSSSYYLCARYFDDSLLLLKKQLLAALIGLGLMSFLAYFDYHRLQQLANLALIASFGLTMLTLMPGLSTGGRWLLLGPLQLQPTELLKLALLVYVASSIVRRGERMVSFSEGVLPHLVILGAAGGLAVAQPDLGMALIYGAIIFFLLFIGRAQVRHLLTCILAGLPMIYLLIRITPYRWSRLVAFLNPLKYGQDKGYQLVQSLTAIGSGGLFGRGLGLGREKLLYLPSAHNDFIAATIAEELGLLGALLLLLLFGFLVYRGFLIVRRAPDQFGFLLGAGFLFTLGLQTALNLGVAAGIFPVTGLTLPFISYGGSSLIVSLAMVGILLNISKQGKEGDFAGLSGWRREWGAPLPRSGDLGGLSPWALRPRGGAPRVYWR